MFKDLGIIRDGGKLDEDAIQDCADCLKQLVPPNLLKSIMRLKGPDFWDVVAGHLWLFVKIYFVVRFGVASCWWFLRFCVDSLAFLCWRSSRQGPNPTE